MVIIDLKRSLVPFLALAGREDQQAPNRTNYSFPISKYQPQLMTATFPICCSASSWTNKTGRDRTQTQKTPYRGPNKRTQSICVFYTQMAYSERTLSLSAKIVPNFTKSAKYLHIMTKWQYLWINFMMPQSYKKVFEKTIPL